MTRKLRLTPRLLAEPFWDAVLMRSEERDVERAALMARLRALEALRDKADYNTGSIAISAAWCLYSLVRYFGVTRAIEVGTFIGKSTIAMASAMDDDGQPGEIVTCDESNALTLPWEGRTRIRQFEKQTSTQMLGALEGTFDFLFLDGRMLAEDVALLDKLTTPQTIVALDDFEGFEKGVANLAMLARTQHLRSHPLIYPPSRALLARHGFTSYSLIAVLLPLSAFEVARQG